MLKRLSLRARIAVVLGIVLALGAAPAWAYWQSQQSVPSSSFTLGRLDLQVNGQDAVTTFTALNTGAIMPGQSVAGVLTVKNNGSIPLSYYAQAQASTALGKAFVVKVTGDSAVSGAYPTATCPGSALPNSATSFQTSAAQLLGTNAARRQLAPGASETVCVQATVSTSSTVAPSSLQGTSTTVSFTFFGKQVAAP
jgi:predicted ribosomally synthesized peptide with SipW-like signal peptide